MIEEVDTPQPLGYIEPAISEHGSPAMNWVQRLGVVPAKAVNAGGPAPVALSSSSDDPAGVGTEARKG